MLCSLIDWLIDLCGESQQLKWWIIAGIYCHKLSQVYGIKYLLFVFAILPSVILFVCHLLNASHKYCTVLYCIVLYCMNRCCCHPSMRMWYWCLHQLLLMTVHRATLQTNDSQCISCDCGFILAGVRSSLKRAGRGGVPRLRGGRV